MKKSLSLIIVCILAATSASSAFATSIVDTLDNTQTMTATTMDDQVLQEAMQGPITRRISHVVKIANITNAFGSLKYNVNSAINEYESNKKDTKKYSDLNSEINALKKNLQDHKKKIAEIENEMQKSSESLLKLQEKLKQIDDQLNKISTLESQLRELKINFNSLRVEINSIDDKIQICGGNINISENDVIIAETKSIELSKIRRQIYNLIMQLSKMGNADSLNKEKAEIENEIDKLKKAQKACEDGVKKLESELDDIQKQIAEKERELKILNQSFETLYKHMMSSIIKFINMVNKSRLMPITSHEYNYICKQLCYIAHENCMLNNNMKPLNQSNIETCALNLKAKLFKSFNNSKDVAKLRSAERTCGDSNGKIIRYYVAMNFKNK